MLSDYYAPIKEQPLECWRWDESEDALRCCVWSVEDQVRDAAEDFPELPEASQEEATVTWCTRPEDPCRKWVLGPDDGC